ncbi:MAG: efflux transporter outer membrane subunit [Kofleriaceae bacterium]|nr:efflux transporter outer membrane subunit [Kofleriaceae bacterium]MBP9168591.1 efflux transporter outer membrane subunit [Kofleriaceae bacterium]MBP9857535.1 efflux transporter outer membrane subunit [Kofleriaceae bacterium]
MRVCPRLVIAFGLAVAACRPHKVVHDPLPPVELPATFAAAPVDGAAAPDRFWTAFADPALDRLIERALTGNFDLRAAWARVEQLGALNRQVDLRWPEVSVGASAARSRAAIPANPLFPDGSTSTSDRFGVQLEAGYEVDLFRRLASQRDAVGRDSAAVLEDTAAIAITIAAEVTAAWLDLRAARAQAAALADQLRTTEAQLTLLEERLRAGLGTSALDIFQQRSLVAQLRGQAAQTTAGEVAIAARLAALCGTTPGQLTADLDAAAPSLPEVPPLPAVGVPAELLVRRPDVAAARRRVEAADYRVAAAVGERYPTLRPAGSVGLSGYTIAQLIETPVYSLIASLAAPLFDGGRRKAKVAQERAVVQERLAGLAKALVSAASEVETALAGERSLLILVAETEQQLALARATLTAARDRYRDGQIDYLPVLSAIQAEQRLALATIELRRQHLGLRLALYRALGGTWARALPAPAALPLRGRHE